MFLVRVGIIALIVLMFLPGQPRSRGGGPSGSSFESSQSAGFCDRYPKTCDASGEILEALRNKLAWGVTWVQGRIAEHRGRTSSSGERSPYIPAREPRNPERFDDWRRFGNDSSYGSLQPGDREPAWHGDRSGDRTRSSYPGR